MLFLCSADIITIKASHLHEDITDDRVVVSEAKETLFSSACIVIATL